MTLWMTWQKVSIGWSKIENVLCLNSVQCVMTQEAPYTGISQAHEYHLEKEQNYSRVNTDDLEQKGFVLKTNNWGQWLVLWLLGMHVGILLVLLSHSWLIHLTEYIQSRDPRTSQKTKKVYEEGIKVDKYNKVMSFFMASAVLPCLLFISTFACYLHYRSGVINSICPRTRSDLHCRGLA